MTTITTVTKSTPQWKTQGKRNFSGKRNGPIWSEHQSAHHKLLGTDGLQIWLVIAMAIFASMLSGDEYVVNAREEMLEAMCGL